ncbi:MAG: hypothetical protein GC149_12495 [Gammaproteobacteria bacterium]|nr:hypothetical protein [Gammaproteobacteria bacterium]
MRELGYRHSASFGKRQEYVAVAELLRRGYDVYMTLVDDQGIDCVVRQGPNKYFDVQIKARSKNCNPKNAGHFPQLTISSPKKNYIFIFYSEAINTYWVIPSTKIVEPGFGNVLKSGPSEGKYRVILTNYSKSKNLVTPRPKYQKYENAFVQAFGEPSLIT